MTNSWEKLVSAFLIQFYLDSKSYGARRMMTGFNNHPEESLYEAYKGYRSFVANCPTMVYHHVRSYISFMQGLVLPIGKN
jgi:hypothetical protein